MLTWTIVSLVIALAALGYAFNAYRDIMTRSPGNEKMQEIAKAIQEGARAFLYAEYKWLAGFVVIVLIAMIATPALGTKMAVAFVLGALASATAGYFGMHTATRAAVRTTEAARTSLGGALDVAFKSGTVMGMTVVGLGMIGICVLMLAYGAHEPDAAIRNTAVEQILGFSFGASSIALFARVGGGIYTKAADVGADLVGKVEAGIPEDSPRNPATIADNVGDNVGDVAGMGADLFESYVGAILATVVLGAAIGANAEECYSLMAFPLAVSALGIVASFLGFFAVKANDETKLAAALFRGLTTSSVVLVFLVAAATFFIKPRPILANGTAAGEWNVFGAVVVGLFCGVLIGKITEYYTSEQRRPAQQVAEQSKTGAATNIIAGLGLGMASTWAPVLLIAGSVYLCNEWAGVYGVCVAAVGMLATLGISLGVDAYGPVADNAGGLAEMAELPKEVRKRTDALDATGNTTAAIGKGFAIGSAALTALALFNTYDTKATALADAQAPKLPFLMDLANPQVTIGLLIGAMLPFLFSSMAMRAVGRAANAMVEEVRRQFREIKGLLEGTARPDYEKCVAISTKGALREMVAPGILAVVSPILVGVIFGREAVGGLLAGSLASGVMMAMFMANAGGAWDNAKKYIEAGNLGGKGSDVHKAAVTGDTVGDPFKDTAGPSINILIKLMSIVAVLALPLFR